MMYDESWMMNVEWYNFGWRTANDKLWMMGDACWIRDDGWLIMNDEWWMMDDACWMLNDGSWMMIDDGWTIDDECWIMDDGWWLMRVHYELWLNDGLWILNDELSFQWGFSWFWIWDRLFWNLIAKYLIVQRVS